MPEQRESSNSKDWRKKHPKKKKPSVLGIRETWSDDSWGSEKTIVKKLTGIFWPSLLLAYGGKKKQSFLQAQQLSLRGASKRKSGYRVLLSPLWKASRHAWGVSQEAHKKRSTYSGCGGKGERSERVRGNGSRSESGENGKGGRSSKNRTNATLIRESTALMPLLTPRSTRVPN